MQAPFEETQFEVEKWLTALPRTDRSALYLDFISALARVAKTEASEWIGEFDISVPPPPLEHIHTLLGEMLRVLEAIYAQPGDESVDRLVLKHVAWLVRRTPDVAGDEIRRVILERANRS